MPNLKFPTGLVKVIFILRIFKKMKEDTTSGETIFSWLFSETVENDDGFYTLTPKILFI